jgi:hypothetical protein
MHVHQVLINPMIFILTQYLHCTKLHISFTIEVTSLSIFLEDLQWQWHGDFSTVSVACSCTICNLCRQCQTMTRCYLHTDIKSSLRCGSMNPTLSATMYTTHHHHHILWRLHQHNSHLRHRTPSFLVNNNSKDIHKQWMCRARSMSQCHWPLLLQWSSNHLDMLQIYSLDELLC